MTKTFILIISIHAAFFLLDLGFCAVPKEDTFPSFAGRDNVYSNSLSMIPLNHLSQDKHENIQLGKHSIEREPHNRTKVDVAVKKIISISNLVDSRTNRICKNEHAQSGDNYTEKDQDHETYQGIIQYLKKYYISGNIVCDIGYIKGRSCIPVTNFIHSSEAKAFDWHLPVFLLKKNIRYMVLRPDSWIIEAWEKYPELISPIQTFPQAGLYRTNLCQWQKIADIVNGETIVSDDPRINYFAKAGISSWLAEEYDWNKEDFLYQEKISMVVIYDSEFTCTDELFAERPYYLIKVTEVDIGCPVEFYKIDKDKLSKPAGKKFLLFGGNVMINGIGDNYWINQSDLETELRPFIKLNLSDKIYACLEGKFKKQWYLNYNENEIYRGYIKLCRIADLPLTATIGRQELSFSRRFLIGEYDGFYVLRLDLDFKPLNINLFAGTRNVGSSIFDFKPRRTEGTWREYARDIEKDVYGTNLLYRPKDIFRLSNIDIYVFHKDDDSPKEETTAVGIRVECKPAEQLRFVSELTKEFGRKQVMEYGDIGDVLGSFNRDAWGGYIQAIWKPKSMNLKPEFRLEYAYLSGNDPDTKDVESFDIICGDNKYADIRWGRVREVDKNMHIFNMGTIVHHLERLELSLYYSYLRRDEEDHYWKEDKYLLEDSKEEGQELDFKAYYSLNKYLSFELFAGFFFPGKAYRNLTDKTRKMIEVKAFFNF